MIKQVCKGLAVAKSRTRVSEIISSSYYYKSPLSETAWPMWSRLCKEQAELQRQMSKRLCKILTLPFQCVYLHVLYSLPPNKLFTCFTAFHLCGNSFLQSQRARALSLITGLLWLLFSHSVVCDSLWTHGLQHARLLCPSLSPNVCSNSCPLTQLRYLTISSSATPFSLRPQSFPALGSLPVGSLHQVAKGLELQLQHQSFQWLFRVDFLLEWTGWISLQSKGLSRVFSNTTVQKYQFFGVQPSLRSNFHIRTWLLEKP